MRDRQGIRTAPRAEEARSLTRAGRGVESRRGSKPRRDFSLGDANGSASLSGRTALVTGASSGLGVDFARELAQRRCRVVLVARREELLKQLQAELQSRHGINAIVMTLDLGDPGAPQMRSEEHTSELQSRRDLVCRLLLEKKNKRNQ